MRKQLKFAGVMAILGIMLISAIMPTLAANVFQDKANNSQLAAVDLVLWTKESDDFISAIDLQGAFDTWAAEYAPGSTLTIETKDVEEVRTELQSAGLAGEGIPDFLWSVADQAGPFVEAGLIQPVDELFDLSVYLNTVLLNGQSWAIPFSAGNHLMLIYNKEYVETPPATVEELIEVSNALIEEYADVEGFSPFLFSQQESFWVFPWMQAINPDGVPFVGFAEDGVTPDLNNDSLIKTFELLASFKESGIAPGECNYDCLDGFFKEGKAAFTINGDWSLGGDTGMIATFGDNLGLAPFPAFEDGQPGPLIAGTYAFIPAATSGDNLAATVAFLEWYTTDVEQVLKYTIAQGRLPGLLAAFDDPAVSEDRLVGESAAALATGVSQPNNVEMRCLFDAITQEYQAVMNGSKDATTAAADAQAFAETCVADLE